MFSSSPSWRLSDAISYHTPRKLTAQREDARDEAKAPTVSVD